MRCADRGCGGAAVARRPGEEPCEGVSRVQQLLPQEGAAYQNARLQEVRSRSAQLATPARTLGCPRHLRGWEELPTSTVDRKGGARGMVSDWCLCRCTCLLLSTVRCVSWVVTIPAPLGGDSNDVGDPVPASSAREVRVVCALCSGSGMDEATLISSPTRLVRMRYVYAYARQHVRTAAYGTCNQQSLGHRRCPCAAHFPSRTANYDYYR